MKRTLEISTGLSSPPKTVPGLKTMACLALFAAATGLLAERRAAADPLVLVESVHFDGTLGFEPDPAVFTRTATGG